MYSTFAINETKCKHSVHTIMITISECFYIVKINRGNIKYVIFS